MRGVLPEDRADGGNSALGMVVRTAFDTEKGSLIRSMLFPKPNKFKFYEDSFRFIGVLAIIAVIGFIASTYNFIRMGANVSTIVVRALDLITIVVPPALPATMSIGTSFAISRLKHWKIFCISPPRVNICGKLNIICFDKTGTLTEEGLDVHGFRFVNSFDRTLSEMNHSMSDLTGSEALADIVVGMACCHSIKRVNDELIGDPLDLKMFEFTGWHLEELEHDISPLSVNGGSTPIAPSITLRPIIHSEDGKESSPLELVILRNFEFVSDLRRMSVIVRRNAAEKPKLGGSGLEVFVKGAPEVMQSICIPESSRPAHYMSSSYF